MRKDAETLYREAETWFASGRTALVEAHSSGELGQLTCARIASLRVSELACRAHKLGLDTRRYNRALRASEALIDGYWRGMHAEGRRRGAN